ncbi:MAG: hypothetical protein WC654_08500 [Patescibacteria group bacterium]
MFSIILFALSFLVTPTFAQDSNDPCAELKANEATYSTCVAQEVIRLARAQQEEADRRLAEALRVARQAEADRATAVEALQDERERADAAEDKVEETQSLLARTRTTTAAIARPQTPASTSPNILESTITRRGVDHAAVFGRQVSPALAPDQVCVSNLDYGIKTHVGGNVSVSSVRIVAISADGVPVVPNAGVSILSYQTLADLEGSGRYQVVTAFSPNVEKICLPAKHGQAITLVYLRDTGINRKQMIDTNGDNKADQVQELPLYGGPSTGSVAVAYPNNSYGIYQIPASAGKRGHHQ